jgi:hypothetical protein
MQRYRLLRIHRRAQTGIDFETHQAKTTSVQTPSGQASQASRINHWTKTHSFFALMGGFVFDVSANPKLCPLPLGETQVTLTPAGIQFLAEREPHVIPDISAEYIRDKSKANHLAKTLVCIQALWFCCSVVSRLAYGLAISLLELNTLAHAVCALFIYLLWWDKPLDVEEPVLIRVDDQDVASLCALLCVKSQLAWKAPVSVDLGKASSLERMLCFCIPPLYGTIKLHSEDAFSVRPELETGRHEFWATRLKETRREANDIATDADLGRRDINDLPLRLQYGSNVAGVSFYSLKNSLAASLFTLFSRKDFNDFGISMEISEDFFALRSVALSNQHRAVLPSITFVQGRESGPQPTDSWHNWTDNRRDLITARQGDFQESYVGFGLWGCILASAMYGAWHILAWNGPFHTSTAELWWKLSSASTACSGICAMLLTLFVYVVGTWLNKREEQKNQIRYVQQVRPPKASAISAHDQSRGHQQPKSSGRKGALKEISRLFFTLIFLVGAMVAVLLAAPIILLLVISRAYLVVGSFVELGYLSDSVFLLPNWSPYFPHIA